MLGQDAGPVTEVVDPTGAVADDALPSLQAALDPDEANHQLVSRLSLHPDASVERIAVVRHKPGRRAIVEYRVCEPEGAGSETLVMLGKVRVKRYGKSGHRRLQAFWSAGFEPSADDRISVPEPLGTIPRFRMWLQRKVPGRPASDLLAADDGTGVARRAAEVAHKVHASDIATDIIHDLDDELRILHDHLVLVEQWLPDLTDRTQRLLAACDRRAAQARPNPPCGVHRDFYGDQILVDGPQCWLLDLDLYCIGDPALDAGNFLGHITEQSIRDHGSPDALAAVEAALWEQFLELEGEIVGPMVQLYADLTLARHVYLSAVRPERRVHTPAILRVAEDRFGL